MAHAAITHDSLWNLMCKLREKSPLVHNITNLVVTNWTANGLLALGASPLMSHDPRELDDICKISDALLLNIGTLDEHVMENMRLAQLRYR